MVLYRKLNSLIRDITGKVSAALEAPAPADKVEQLLAARDESRERMLKLERRQGDIGFTGFLSFFPGLGLTIAAITGAAVATPLLAAGLGLAALSVGTMFVTGKALDRLRADRDTIEKQINREAQDIAKAHPKEADKSPRFLGALHTVFNCAAAPGDTSYAKMVARVAKKGPAAPTPAA